MCFSASASFGASMIIGSIGGVALKKAKTSSQKVFALIPIFFAMQQFIEGLLWLYLLEPAGTSSNFGLISTTTYLFLIFAWIIWPSFIPYTFYLLEKNIKRKRVLKGLVFLGILVSIVLTYILIFHKTTPIISNYHIRYEVSFTHSMAWVLAVFYIVSTVFSCFVSSIKWIWSLGVINLCSYVISKLVFGEYVLSVWCFFAAISSVIILFIIFKMIKEENTLPFIKI